MTQHWNSFLPHFYKWTEKKQLNWELFKVKRRPGVKINKYEDQEVLKKNSDSYWAIKAVNKIKLSRILIQN